MYLRHGTKYLHFYSTLSRISFKRWSSDRAKNSCCLRKRTHKAITIIVRLSVWCLFYSFKTSQTCYYRDKVATECIFNILRPINVNLVHNKTKSCNKLSWGYESHVKTDKQIYNIFVLYALSVRCCYVGFVLTSLVNKSIITRVTLSGVLLN